jgi:hypothetical protein
MMFGEKANGRRDHFFWAFIKTSLDEACDELFIEAVDSWAWHMAPPVNYVNKF